MSKNLLEIKDLHAKIDDLDILKGMSLEIGSGEIHYLMGKNGAGKSTVAKVLMGHPDYEITDGEIVFEGENIEELETDERSLKGIYLANQYPIEVPGVNLFNFLRLAYNARLPKEDEMPVFKFKRHVRKSLELLNIPESFLDRNLNEGFSGGEKKKCEILQMAVLEPKFVILDETDSGLDVDSLKEVFEGIKKIKAANSEMSLLVITHYERVSGFLKADKVHVLENGTVVKTGGAEIVDEIQTQGYGRNN